jgi:hypothetical protein
MTEPNNAPEQGNFLLDATLFCGTKVRIEQRGIAQVLEMTFTPKEGTSLQDFAYIKDGALRVNADIMSLAGMSQLLGMMFRRKRKKFLGIF